MYVAFRKSTGEVIKDFQSKATPDGLIKNAIASGIAASDVVVRDVTPEEAKVLENGAFSAERAAAEAATSAADRELDARGEELIARLKITRGDLETLRYLLARV